jgi:hypothetical protein
MDEIERGLKRIKELASHPPIDVSKIPPEVTGGESERFNTLREATFSQQAVLFRRELAELRASWRKGFQTLPHRPEPGETIH